MTSFIEHEFITCSFFQSILTYPSYTDRCVVITYDSYKYIKQQQML